MQEIKCYKLVTGEEIIGMVDNTIQTDRDHILLKNIRVLIMQPTERGHIGIAMLPWMISTQDTSVELTIDKIVGVSVESIPREIENAYLQQVSGIQIASGNNSQIRA